jgi:hypothetical protein
MTKEEQDALNWFLQHEMIWYDDDDNEDVHSVMKECSGDINHEITMTPGLIAEIIADYVDHLTKN